MKYFITLIFIVFLVEYSQSQVNLCQGSLGDPVVNITFGSGTSTFGPSLQTTATGYGYQNSSCIIDNHYEITNQVFGCYPGDWHDLPQDHTGNPGGYFMLIGASNTPSDFYLDTVKNLCANTTYEFAAWVLNMMLPSGCSSTGGLRPNITFSIEDVNGNSLGIYNTGDIGVTALPTWIQYGLFFTTPANATSIVLRMTNNGLGGCGNDIALDDITFRTCGPTTTASFNSTTFQDSISVCGGSNITLYGNTTNGYTNPGYLWQLSTDSGKTWTDIPNSNALQINLTAPVISAQKNYKYRMLTGKGNNINSINCRVASNATILHIKAPPQGKLTGSNICAGDIASLQLISATGSPPFSISYTDGIGTFIQNNLNNNSFFATPNALSSTTTFIIKSIIDATGCSNTGNLPDSAIIINVHAIPQGGITGSTACTGAQAYLNFSGSQGSPLFSIQLSDGNGTVKIDSLAANGSVGVSVASNNNTYTLLSITDKYGCTRSSNFNSSTATINVIPSPNISFGALPSVCENDSPFAITQATETSGIQGSGFFLGSAVTVSGIFNPSLVAPGNYPIVYEFTATNGCTDSSVQQIIVKPTPAANAGPDLLGCINSSIQLNASGGISYQWSPPTGLSNPAVADPVVTLNTTTSYIVTVTNAEGCIAYDSLTVTISPLGKAAYKVPNAFTPNGDGKNDCFGLSHWGGIELKEFSIYNRWGQRVFFTKNPSICWDGTFKGIPQDSGGFIYIIHAITPCGDINLKGTIFLIR